MSTSVAKPRKTKIPVTTTPTPEPVSVVKPDYDPLAQYALWYRDAGSRSIPMAPIANGIRRLGNMVGLVLQRSNEFSVQLWVSPGGLVIPAHTHENTDLIICYVSGEIKFDLNGANPIPEENTVTSDGRSSRNGRWFRAKPGDIWGATIYESGGAFMVFARGRDPIDLDWQGSAVDEDHRVLLDAKAPKE